MVLVLGLGLVGCQGMVNKTVRKRVVPAGKTWTDLEQACAFGVVGAAAFPIVTEKSSPDGMMLSGLAGGVCHLMLVRGDVSRCQMLSMFLKMETGEHVRSPCVEIVRCVAYRVEPLDPSPPGVLTLDGEVVAYGPLQARVRPRAATIQG